MISYRLGIANFLQLTVIAFFFSSISLAVVRADNHSQTNPCHQSYPNITGTVLLENDKVVVQRFTFPPGKWEGVHSHPAGQIYIHIKGGEWTVRFGDEYEKGYSETGSVGWYGPVALSADHESVNSGTEPIDLIWVTLKSECSAGDQD